MTPTNARCLPYIVRLLIGLLVCAAGPVVAQDAYPNKMIRFVVPFGAGGANDIIARRLHEIVNRQGGSKVVVENHVGADGTIGTSRVANADPDGYTIGMSASTILGNIAIGKAKLKVESFTPIARVSTDPLMLIVSTKSASQSLETFMAHLKANPESVTMASPSINNLNHIFGLMTGRAVGATPVVASYPSGARALSDVIGGQVDFTVTKPSETKGHIDGGLVKPLAIFSDERIASYPDVPTMKERGYDVFPYGPMVQMSYVVAPANIPPHVKQKLITMYRDAIQSPEFRKFAQESGFLVDDLTGDALAKTVDDVYAGIKRVATHMLVTDQAGK